MFDYDKLIAFLKVFGAPTAGCAWLAWELHRFVDRVADAAVAQVAVNQQIAILLQRLIDMHTK